MQLASAVASMSQNCAEQTIADSKVRQGDDYEWLRYFIFCEFVYCFFHLADRFAARSLGNEEKSEVMEPLGLLLGKLSIETYCGHMPKDLQAQMETEFFKTLNVSQRDYRPCKVIMSEEPPLSKDGVTDLLGYKVERLIASNNVLDVVRAKHLAVSALAANDLRDLIRRAAEA